MERTIELYGDAKADYHLLEALLRIKKAIIHSLSDYSKQIDKHKGFVIVKVLPEEDSTDVIYESNVDSEFTQMIKLILKNIDYPKAISGIGDSSLN